LQWDPTVAEVIMEETASGQLRPRVTDSALISIGEVSLPMIGGNNFSSMAPEWPGVMVALWDEATQPDLGRTVADETILFALHFKLVGDPGSSTSLTIGNLPTPFKIVSANEPDIFEAAPNASIDILNTITVSGDIQLFGQEDKAMPGVEVRLVAGSDSYQTTTDTSGHYELTVFPAPNMVISARQEVDTKANKGVDVSDIIELRKHILHRAKLSSPLSWIAADANRDASIDVADIVGMRKVILNRTNHYSEDSEGHPEDIFQFVNEQFNLGETSDSFDRLEDARIIEFSGQNGDVMGLDFHGVKLGDSNGDWAPPASGSGTSSARFTAGPRPGQLLADAALSFGALELANEGSLSLPVYATSAQALLGVQFELNWDGSVLALDGLSSTSLPGFSPEFHASIESGTAKVAWDDATLSGFVADGTEALLTLHFSRLHAGATGLELEVPVLAGEQGSLGWVQPASVYVRPDNTTQPAFNGGIKAIEVQGGQLRLLVDTQTGQGYELQSTAKLDQPAWQGLVKLDGCDTWQEVVLPAEAFSAYLRLVPVEAELR